MCATIAWVLWAVCAAGCGTNRVVEGDADRAPEPFTLELLALGVESRSVYYVLDGEGMLRYGGGSDARNRLATIEVGKLDDGERLALWRVVVEGGLLDAEGTMFPQRKLVEYEFSVRAGTKNNSIRCADDEVQGMAEFERALFELQTKKRFGLEP